MALKDRLLEELEEHRDTNLSGEALAVRFGVSRAAIWKAIKALRADGYEILSATNRGYRLAPGSDVLSSADIERRLHAPLTVQVLEAVDSTNTEAKRQLLAGEQAELLLVANCQTGGRGRLGRSFLSPPGTGLYMTVVLHSVAELSDAVLLTTVASAAVVEAVEALTPYSLQIKWVNDLYLQGKKVGGILTEAVTDCESGTVSGVIVGIGLNVRPVDFPPELSDIADCLDIGAVTRNHLAAEIANRLYAYAAQLPLRSYLPTYRAHSLVIGRRVICMRGSEITPAEAVAIDDDGGLVVRLPNGDLQTLHSGEITVRLG